MKKNILYQTFLIAIGISLGIFIITEFNPSSSSSVFASEKNIGLKSAPLIQSDFIKALNNAYTEVSTVTTKSVVLIEVESEMSDRHGESMKRKFQEFFEHYGGKAPEGKELKKPRTHGSGSGVIVSTDGYIVTNAHVVDGAMDGGIIVHLDDNNEYVAELIGSDELTDIAVLKIDKENLNPVHFANPKDLKIGQMVLAVGSPLGLRSTVTSGIVSAIGRGRIGMGGGYSVEHFIQTDAAINPGNSGGGLFNLDGSLVGINTAIATRTGSYIGYGFAIPVEIAKAVIEDLIEDGRVNRGYIGVGIETLDDPTIAKALGLEEVSGVLISKIMSGSAADDAGIILNDVILELDGEKLTSSHELQSKIVLRRAGDKVKLKIWRDGKAIIKTVKLKPRDEDELASTEKIHNDIENEKTIGFDELGFLVEPLSGELMEKHGLDYGVVVTEVERYSIADKRGIFEGGIIYKADRKKINSPSDLSKILSSKKAGDVILLNIRYEDNNRLVAIEIPRDDG